MRSWVLGVLCVGCYSGIPAGGEPPSPVADDTDGSDPDGTEPQRDPSSEEPSACEAETVNPAVLRRLTRAEYNNTVRDLLGDHSAPADAFSPDELTAGFAANSTTPISSLALDQVVGAAETLAHSAVTERWAAVVGCDAKDRPCLVDWVGAFGSRAFRRPLDEAELLAYDALLDDAAAQWGDQAAVELVLTAMLQSPHFLYHLDTEPAYATASRLSYFLWQSMPDQALFDAAAAGALATAAQREQQARRLLEDPRAKDAVGSFHVQLLELSGLHLAFKDPELFPEWDAELATTLRDETAQWSATVVLDGDATLDTLLTASWTISSPELAALYGVEPPFTADRLELDPAERAGLLTHASVLASTSGPAENSWVHRGKLLREKILCQPLQPPPPGADTSNADAAQRLEDPYCATCHVLMDPIGEGFDDYSPIGVYADNGGHGDVRGAAGLGEFTGVVDLAEQLAGSALVRDCFAAQWFRYALRRDTNDADDCAIQHVGTVFAESDGDVRELIVALGGEL